MKFVAFVGKTPYFGTDFEDYAAFGDDTPEEEIKQHAKQLALDYARAFDWMFDREVGEPTVEEYNVLYQDYLSQTIDNTKWKYISDREFSVALDDME
jgi:hypothetical protein